MILWLCWPAQPFVYDKYISLSLIPWQVCVVGQPAYMAPLYPTLTGSKWTVSVISPDVLTKPAPTGDFFLKAKVRYCTKSTSSSHEKRRRDSVVPKYRYDLLYICLYFIKTNLNSENYYFVYHLCAHISREERMPSRLYTLYPGQRWNNFGMLFIAWNAKRWHLIIRREDFSRCSPLCPPKSDCKSKAFLICLRFCPS